MGSPKHRDWLNLADPIKDKKQEDPVKGGLEIDISGLIERALSAKLGGLSSQMDGPYQHVNGQLFPVRGPTRLTI